MNKPNRKDLKTALRALEKIVEMTRKEDDSSVTDAVWSSAIRPVAKRGLSALRRFAEEKP